MNDDIEQLLGRVAASGRPAGTAPAGTRGGGKPIGCGTCFTLAAAIRAGRGGVHSVEDCNEHLCKPSGRASFGPAFRPTTRLEAGNGVGRGSGERLPTLRPRNGYTDSLPAPRPSGDGLAATQHTVTC